MKFSLTHIVDDNNDAYYKEVRDIQEDDLELLLTTEHSFCIHTDNRRLNSTIESVNGIIIDFDGKGDHLDSSIAEVMASDFWKQYYGYIITSKSHGTVERDCFHYYIEFKKGIPGNKKISVLRNIQEQLKSCGLSFDADYNPFGYINPSPNGRIIFSNSIELFDAEEIAVIDKDTDNEISQKDKNLITMLKNRDIEKVDKIFAYLIRDTVQILQSDIDSPLRKKTFGKCVYDIKARGLLTPSGWWRCLGGIKSVFGTSDRGRKFALLISQSYTKNSGSRDSNDLIIKTYDGIDESKYCIEDLTDAIKYLIINSNYQIMLGKISKFYERIVELVGVEIDIDDVLPEQTYTTSLRSRKVYTSNKAMLKKEVVDTISDSTQLPSSTVNRTVRKKMNNKTLNLLEKITIDVTDLVIEHIDNDGFIQSSKMRKLYNEVCQDLNFPKTGIKTKTTKFNFKSFKENFMNAFDVEEKMNTDGIYIIRYKKAIEPSTSLEAVETIKTIPEQVVEPVSHVFEHKTVYVNIPFNLVEKTTLKNIITDEVNEDMLTYASPPEPIYIGENKTAVFPNIRYETIDVLDYDAEYDAGITYEQMRDYEIDCTGFSNIEIPTKKQKVYTITGLLTENEETTLSIMEKMGYINVGEVNHRRAYV